LQWPEDAPRSIGDLATRVSDPLKTELNTLCSSTYGPNGKSWHGKNLAKALRSFAVESDDQKTTADDELPPLLPGPIA
jgi:hypothetical protein